MRFDTYALPDGSIVNVDISAAKGIDSMPFQLADHSFVTARRVMSNAECIARFYPPIAGIDYCTNCGELSHVMHKGVQGGDGLMCTPCVDAALNHGRKHTPEAFIVAE